MQLRRLETFATRFIAFVRVTADDGSQGWGQLSTYQSDITALVFHRQVAPYVLGVDISTVDAPTLMALGNRVFEKEHKFPGSYLKRAVGGLDTALWDLAGKRAGLPVCALLGGTPGTLRAYASSMRRDITPEEEAERFRRLRGEFGFDAFKFRVGAEYGHDVDEWPGRTEAIVPAIRKALGPGASLLVDANSAFSPARGIEVGRLLQDWGISHYEEPCPYWELEQTRQVREALDLDVTGGEQDCWLPT
ncbi:MAG TPA: mandelate racemase/muconate lactonizing enzyme family protein, partial [Kiloniellales bacterium]|nr:mandelate racemase/muconate lactonizing enzyme family protein [Kiloniellales bacterium]